MYTMWSPSVDVDVDGTWQSISLPDDWLPGSVIEKIMDFITKFAPKSKGQNYLVDCNPTPQSTM